MEIFGGFMVMISILALFLVTIWLIMPFVVLTIKGKLDRTLDMLTGMQSQLDRLENRLIRMEQRSSVTHADQQAPAQVPANEPAEH